jgi:hypothetical protein
MPWLGIGRDIGTAISGPDLLLIYAKPSAAVLRAGSTGYV